MKEKTCFKNPNRSTCMDFFLIGSPHSFQSMTISSGLSDFPQMSKVLQSPFIKLKAKETYHMDLKKFKDYANLRRANLALSLD